MARRSPLYARWSMEMRRCRYFHPGDRVGVAVSGGADSTLLLRFMTDLAPQFALRLAVVHFNHHLRGTESDADQETVRQQAERMGLEFLWSGADVARAAGRTGRSLEAVARELRYRFFFSLVRRGELIKIATAHTADDQAETVLLRMLRGAGTRGLAGIYPVLDGVIVRPFLSLKRSEVEAELAALGLPYRIDSSNSDLRFVRNRVRAVLLPLLQREFNADIIDALNALAERNRDDESYLEQQASERARAWRIRQGREERIALEPLLQLPPSLLRRVLRQIIEAARGSLRGITYRHIEELRRFARQTQSGRGLELVSDLEARKEFGWLALGAPTSKQAREYRVPVRPPAEVQVAEARLRLRFETCENADTNLSGQAYNEDRDCLWLDLDKLADELILRSWRPGDRFQPAGSRRGKKLKELFQKARVPLSSRRSMPVLECDGKVVWAYGFPPSVSSLASKDSRRLLKITVIESGV